MKLAFLSPCWSGPHYGGVQLTARLALEALSRGGNSVRFLGYGPACERGAHSDAVSRDSVELCSRSRRGAAFAALRYRAWPDRLLFWHADLLKLLPFIGARGRRKLLFLHGIECWRKMDGALASGLDQIDVFLSNSDFTWQRFIAANPRWAGAKHCTIPLGLGTPELNVERPANIPAAIMIGRMSKGEGYKGHEEVIGAWPRVLQAIPQAELWIVGGGDAAAGLRALAAVSEAGERIRFFGVVSDAQKDRLLRHSRCLVLPSRGEGFGLVYLEAMRLGRPCLASIHDAGREVVGPPEAGLAVDPANPEELAQAIARLLTPGAEWERWSAVARRRYESGFTAVHFQRRLVEAVKEELAA
ncbi:MAG TPA: glycosyltransferase family 4 protein [Bryobacteraceae bacterium]|jgi:phosphatidylinositol alpha-1,6-mannosyltransferase|nr:glycosyltransferase family 4 protein [Bryobacteraceae bacterium]